MNHKKSASSKCDYCGKDYLAWDNTKSKSYLENVKKHYCSNECKHLGRRSRVIITCATCGKEKELWTCAIKNGEGKFCSMACKVKASKKRYLNQQGYIELFIDGKLKKEHRQLMEEYLNRKLKPWEIVHHINFIRDDNRIENLQVMTRREHIKIHINN